MNSICLITFRPDKIWCDFLNSFVNYKIFIIVDDNNFNLVEFETNYTNIKFIKVEDEKCKSNGYIDTNFTLKKLISGWDKALYYFGIEYLDNDFIWFIEDDVFFYNESTLVNIDNNYNTQDLLCNNLSINAEGIKNGWHWNKIKINYSPPYYYGMMCAVRFSNKMMKSINDYAKLYKTLFFLEALFPTIAKKNDLVYFNPSEFRSIHYRRNFQITDIKNNNLYHPVKNFYTHNIYRQNLK